MAEPCNFRPPHALTLWTDNNSIYAEIPATSGPSLVLEFAMTEGGLSKALALLKERQQALGPKPGHYKIPDPIKTFAKGAPTDADRAKARAALRAAGII